MAFNRDDLGFYGSLAFTSLALILAVWYIFHDPSHKPPPNLDSKLVGILIAAALPWVVSRVEVIKGAGFEVRQRLREQDEKLNLLTLQLMEPDIFDTLQSLVKYDFTFRKDDRLLYEHFKHLFNINCISRSPDSISDPQENVGNGRIVTQVGRDFIAAREKMEEANKKKRAV